MNAMQNTLMNRLTKGIPTWECWDDVFAVLTEYGWQLTGTFVNSDSEYNHCPEYSVYHNKTIEQWGVMSVGTCIPQIDGSAMVAFQLMNEQSIRVWRKKYIWNIFHVPQKNNGYRLCGQSGKLSNTDEP